MPELSFAEVGEILHLLQSIEASIVELEWGDLKIHVRRGGSALTRIPAPDEEADLALSTKGQSSAADLAVGPQITGSGGSGAAPVAEANNPAGTEHVPAHWVPISAPMAGTFYRAAKPEDPPFVEVGDLVAPGDTVALVEVMKLFTELTCGLSGTVARIDAVDSGLVEFGQALVWIEPA